jgi:hypothetical protein
MVNMANWVIPPWRGQAQPTQLPPLHYYNSGTTFYQQPPGNYSLFNPGTMRNNQPPSESEDLKPLDPQEPLSPQTTGSQHGGFQGRKPTPKKALPIHFLEREPETPKYTGGRKTVKIKPLDKELCFDGSNMPVEKFIKRYIAAGNADGASPEDLASQILHFIKGSELQEEVEEMSGYEYCNWKLLKEQLFTRFGNYPPEEFYCLEDLENLAKIAHNMGGMKTLEQFKTFRKLYENVTHHMVRQGYISNSKVVIEWLFEGLSPELKSAVMNEIIESGNAEWGRDEFLIFPDSKILLHFIHREFSKIHKFQESPNHPDQPAKEIRQKNQHSFSQRPMEEYSSEIHSPLTENSSPVLYPTLDSCPLTLENSQSLKNFETLDNTEIKHFGSAKIPSEISLPGTIIEDNGFPVAPENLEPSPQLLENSPQLQPLDENKAEHLGSEREICARIIFSEEDLPVGKVEDTTDNPVPETQNLLTILVKEKNEEKFSQDKEPEVLVTLGFSPQLPQNCKELEPLDKKNPGPEIATCEEIRPTEETLPVEGIPESLGNLLPANLEEKFGEEETEEICSNNFNPVDGSALQIVVLDQLPTINSEVLITGKTEAPDSASSEIPQFGSPEICIQKNPPSLESLKIELILAGGKEKSHMVPEVNIIGQQIAFPFFVTPESSAITSKVIFQKDPGKTIRNFISSAFVINPQPEVLAAFLTHQKTLLHQYRFQNFTTPGISPSFIKPPTATPENIGKGKPAKFRNKRFNTISLKQTSSRCLGSHSLKFRNNTLHFMSFLVKVKRRRHSVFQFHCTPVDFSRYGLNSLWLRVKKISPVVCFTYWNISANSRSKVTRKRKKMGFQLITALESRPPSGPFGTQTQPIHVEAITFASLVLKSLDQNFKEKKQKRWINFKIILPFGTAECTPLIRLLIEKMWIEARATGVDLLQSNHWAQNTINKRYWMLMVGATSFASWALVFLVQKVGKEEKEDSCGQLLWIWQAGRSNNQSNSRNYKIIAVGPTSLALWTLNSKQTKQSISQNITGHSSDTDTIVLDPLKKRRLTDHWKRSTVTREISSPEIVVQIRLYNDYGYGSGEIEDSLFSSCSDTFDVICQASCMGRPRATEMSDCLDQKARNSAARKVPFHRTDQEIKTREKWSLMLIDSLQIRHQSLVDFESSDRWKDQQKIIMINPSISSGCRPSSFYVVAIVLVGAKLHYNKELDYIL